MKSRLVAISKFTKVPVIFLTVVLVACRPGATALPTAIPSTGPTNTAVPTDTSLSTNTPEPAIAPRPTATFTAPAPVILSGTGEPVPCRSGAGPGPGGKPRPPSTAGWTDTMLAHNAPGASVGSGSHGGAVYYTPHTFVTILADGFTPKNLATVDTLTNCSRILIQTPDGSFLTVGASGAAEATTTLATYRDTLTKVVQAVAEPSDPSLFRFDSELHGLYSLDVGQGNLLVFQNNWGAAETPVDRGYVTFRYDSSVQLLKAESRQIYNLGSFIHAPSAFENAGWYVHFEAGRFTLVPTAAGATRLMLLKAPMNVDMPTDFNPDSIPYQPNPRVPVKEYLRNTIADIEGDRSKVSQNLADVYKAQVAAPGNSSLTQPAAQAALAEIKITLEAENAQLRYAPELYLAFRDGALSTQLQSDGIANGTLGMNVVPYVFFTNAADSNGTHHPFMVIASYSISDKPNRLLDVSRPPGDGTKGGYADQKVTRDATLQLYLVKIPLRDYGLVSSLTENKLPKTLKSDAHDPGPDSVYNAVSTSAVGIAVDGVVIYPPLNNTLASAQESAEITSNGIHVGRGMGLHYHADGHSATNNDLSLYNINDYPGQGHPPLIGFGLDGIALFGIYEAVFPMDGSDVPLDQFGGHSHEPVGYHYHALNVSAKSMGGIDYTLHVLLKGAWKGIINDIPEFWDTRRGEPAYSLQQQSPYVGKK